MSSHHAQSPVPHPQATQAEIDDITARHPHLAPLLLGALAGPQTAPTGPPGRQADPSLAAKYPHLAAMLTPGQPDPETISVKSDATLRWQCPDGHVYEQPVSHQVTFNGTCPSCATLAHRHPHLAATLAPGQPDPETIYARSGRTYEWVCPDGHLYQRSVVAQVSADGKCPRCLSLAVLHPDLAATLAPGQPGPSTIAATSNRRLAWFCPNGHLYERKVSRQVTLGGECPKCRSLAVLHPESPPCWHRASRTHS